MKTLFLRDGQYWLHSSSYALLKEQMILILKGKKKLEQLQKQYINSFSL